MTQIIQSIMLVSVCLLIPSESQFVNVHLIQDKSVRFQQFRCLFTCLITLWMVVFIIDISLLNHNITFSYNWSMYMWHCKRLIRIFHFQNLFPSVYETCTLVILHKIAKKPIHLLIPHDFLLIVIKQSPFISYLQHIK